MSNNKLQPEEPSVLGWLGLLMIIAVVTMIVLLVTGCSQQCPLHEIEPGIYLIDDYE